MSRNSKSPRRWPTRKPLIYFILLLKKELVDYLRSKRRMAGRDMLVLADSHGSDRRCPLDHGKDPRRRKTERFLVIGKGIC